MNNIILLWLKENITRLFAKSQMFFKVWSIISAAFVLMSGLPDFINWLHLFQIEIPTLWNDKVNLIVAWCSRGALLMSMLSTESKAVAKDETGAILKQTNQDKLPFTAKVENNKPVETIQALPTVTPENNFNPMQIRGFKG